MFSSKRLAYYEQRLTSLEQQLAALGHEAVHTISRTWASDLLVLSPGIPITIFDSRREGAYGLMLSMRSFLPGDAMQLIVSPYTVTEEGLHPAPAWDITFSHSPIVEVESEERSILREPVQFLPEITALHGIHIAVKQLRGMPRQIYFEAYRR